MQVEQDGLRLINVVLYHEDDYLAQWQKLSRADLDLGRAARARNDFWAVAAAAFRGSGGGYLCEVDAFQLHSDDDIEDVLGFVPHVDELASYCAETGFAAEYPDDKDLGNFLRAKLGNVRRDLVVARSKHTVSGNGDSYSDNEGSEVAGSTVFSKKSSDFTNYLSGAVQKYAYRTLVGDILTACVASMPDDAKSGSEQGVAQPELPNAKRRRKINDQPSLEQAQWDMIERVTQTAASIASNRSAGPDVQTPALVQEQVRAAAARAQEAQAEALRSETKGKEERVVLFERYQTQYGAIMTKLQNVHDTRLESVLQIRAEGLLQAMSKMAAERV